MRMTDAILTALMAGGKSQGDLAVAQDVSKQAISNKISRGTWSGRELLDVAKLTGSKLMYEFPDGTRIIIDDPQEEAE